MTEKKSRKFQKIREKKSKKCRGFSKIFIFVQNFDFYGKFRFMSKISFFVENFDFYVQVMK